MRLSARIIGCVWLMALAIAPAIRAEYEQEEARPKKSRSQLLKTRRAEPSPKEMRAEKADKTFHPEPSHSKTAYPLLETWGFSARLNTPLIKEVGIHRRFKTFGLDGTVSIPLAPMGPYSYLHLEAGLGLSLARASIPPLVSSFTSLIISLPLRARLLIPMGSDKITLEILAGLRQRLFEFDSRTGTNGGFFFLTPIFDNMDPNFGLGLAYRVSQQIAIRVTVEYLSLTAGIEF